MLLLGFGLLIFLGVHSTRIAADAWRTRCIAQYGAAAWKGVYSLVSLLGLALVVWGYGQARQQPVVLWLPPAGMRHAAALLTLVSFVLLAAAYVPGNHIKARLKHPMLVAVKLWALAHLLANGNLADVLLFGGFLLWALLCFHAARQRDRAAPAVPVAPGALLATCLSVGLGIVGWLFFAIWLHGRLIGVRPFS